MRWYLSSKERIIVLDNAESILGLAEMNSQEIYPIVDELSRFKNICLVITSRISNTLPPHCETIQTPTLSMEAGRETFYRIYRLGEQSDEINGILKELDFHPLSITLLATVSQQNRWNTKRLTAEWERQRTGVLRARNLGSLAATIELSLASPMFQELGPDSREVLGVVAFFPQGVDEDSVSELFPAISDGPSMFDTFCNLSLTFRGNGFITMLVPLRDYLYPKDPATSPLLRTVKEHYFRRLSATLTPSKPGSDESRWIMSEDVNVEHLLDVFTTIDANSNKVWNACAEFMDLLYWQKPRLVVLELKVEALPDSHPAKPLCLFFLSRLFNRVGNWREQKRLLVHSSGLWGGRGGDYWVANTLIGLADANRHLGLGEEGIQQAREALDILGRLGETGKQADSLLVLALLLYEDRQLDAAEEAATRAMELSEDRHQHKLSQSHKILGHIQQSKGNREKAIHHFEASLRIASSVDSHDQLSESHVGLAIIYIGEGKLDDAHTHVGHAKSYAGNDMFLLGCAFHESARVLHHQNRPEEAKSEALRALSIFEEIGATNQAERTRRFLEGPGS